MIEQKMFVFLLVLGVITNVASGRLLITPDREVTVNRTARHVFECSTNTGSIQWKHKHLGAIRPTLVYDGDKLINGYAYSGRFSVVGNGQRGQYNLVISSVELDDAGEFYCTDDNGRGEQAVSIFHVLENLPELLISPSDVYEMVGRTVRLHCSTTYFSTPVYWKHRPVGSNEIHTVYYGEHGLQNGYRRSGRFSVVESEDGRVYDLQITSVSSSDAGTYTCIDNSGLGKSASAELVIINSNPSCESDVGPDGVLFENSCGLGPDKVGLSCSVGYIGNQAPSLVWKNGHHKVQHSAFPSPTNVISGRINVTASMDTTWSKYVCQVGRYSCTPTIDKFLYIQETLSSKSIVRSEQFKCYINSTLPCSYEWSRTDEFGSEIVSFKQIYRPPYPGSYMCTAKCDIRGKPCRIDVFNVDFQNENQNNNKVKPLERTIVALSIIVSLILMVAVSLVVIIYFLRKNKKTSVAISGYTALPLGSNDFTLVMSLTLLKKKIYIIDKTCRDVSVYKDSPPYHFVEKIHLPKLKNPRNIDSSNALNCLFINDLDVEGTVHKVFVSVSRIPFRKDKYESMPIISKLKPDYAFSLRQNGCGVLIARSGIVEIYNENGEFQFKIETLQQELSSPPKQIIDLGGEYLQSFKNSEIKIYNTDGSVQQQFKLPEFSHRLIQGGDDFYVTTSQSTEIFFVRFSCGKLMTWNPKKDGNSLQNYTEVATLKQDVEKPGDFAQTLCIDEESGRLLAITSYGEIHEIHYNKGDNQINSTNPRSNEEKKPLKGKR